MESLNLLRASLMSLGRSGVRIDFFGGCGGGLKNGVGGKKMGVTVG